MGLPGLRETTGGPWKGAQFMPAPGRPTRTAPAPLPTKDTKLVLSMSIQMPKQKIRLPRTWGEEGRAWPVGKGGFEIGQLRQGLGPGLGSREATHEEEEVENEEEVLDEAEAAVLG